MIKQWQLTRAEISLSGIMTLHKKCFILQMSRQSRVYMYCILVVYMYCTLAYEDYLTKYRVY